MSKNHKVAVGMGLAALMAAAAGAAFLFGTEEGAKKREKIKSWMFKMRADIMDKLEEAKGELDETAYGRVIDEVADKYAGLKNIDLKVLKSVATDLKKHWKTIKKQITVGAKAHATDRAENSK